MGPLETLERLPTIILTPIFFGAVFTTMLFGIASLQIYHYFCRYRKDPQLEKCFVGLTWLFDAGHLGITIYIAYNLLVIAWDNPLSLLNRTFSRAFQHQMALTMIMVGYLHTLYGIMAWKLSCHVHWIITYHILFVILVGHGIGIFAIIEIYKFDIQGGPKLIENFVQIFGHTSFYSGLASAMVVDLVLAIFLCFVLRRSRVEFSESKSAASFISQYTIASGVLVSAFQVAILITSAAVPTNFVFYALEMLLPGVHTISYLCLLNARTVFRHGVRCTKTPHMPLIVHINTLTAIASPGNHGDSGRRKREEDKEKGTGVGMVGFHDSKGSHARTHGFDKASLTDSSRSVVDLVV